MNTVMLLNFDGINFDCLTGNCQKYQNFPNQNFAIQCIYQLPYIYQTGENIHTIQRVTDECLPKFLGIQTF